MNFQTISISNERKCNFSPLRQIIMTTNTSEDSVSFNVDPLLALHNPLPQLRFPFRITDVDVKKDSNGDSRVVIVTFEDGTTEKAVTSDNDTFNLEQGIQICVAKRAFSCLNKNGSSTFNKLVNKAVKLYKGKCEAVAKETIDELQQKARVKKRAEKKARWIEKKKAKEREARVNEMAEAYAKALKMVNEDKDV